MKGFILELISELIRIYNVCGVKDERAWDILHVLIFYDPVTTRHFGQIQPISPNRRCRSSAFREWWVAFRSYMGQMFAKTHDQMNNWRWDNSHAFRDQVDRSNPQTTSSGMVKSTGHRFPCDGSDDLRSKIEPPSCQEYNEGNILAVRPLNWDEIIDEDDDDDEWVDPRAPGGGRSRPGDCNDSDDGDGEEDTQGGEKENGNRKEAKGWKGKQKASEDGKGKWKATVEVMGNSNGNGNWNGKGKGIVKQTLRGESSQSGGKVTGSKGNGTRRAILSGYIYSRKHCPLSIALDDDTDSTEESDGEYDSENESDQYMRMEDDVDAPDGVDSDGDVDIEWDGDDQDEEDEVEEDEEEHEEEEEDEDEDKDEDQDDSKEPQTISQGEIVNTLADDVDTIVDNQPTVLPQHGQEMCEHTPRPLPSAPAPRPRTPEHCPQPRTQVPHPLCGLEFPGRVTLQKPRPAAPTMREAEAAGNSSDVDVEWQFLGELAGGDSLPDVRLHDVPLTDVPLTDLPLTDVPLTDIPLNDVPRPEALLDASVGEESTSPRHAQQACIRVRVGF